MKLMRGMAILLLALAVPRPAAAGLQIADVHHEPAAIDLARGEEAVVHFRLTGAAAVTGRIYDGRDLLVRTIDLGNLAAGAHRLVWDGADENGAPVPPEAYAYTLTATGPVGEIVEHDLTDRTGGEMLDVADLRFDSSTGRILYGLPSPARVALRVGLAEGGPLLATLVDWAPRGPGLREEAWDGKLGPRAVDLATHPKLQVSAIAFSLPRNSIRVLPETNAPVVLADLPWGKQRRPRKVEPERRMMAYPELALEERRSFSPQIEWPAGIRLRDGVAQIAGVVPVRFDLSPDERARALAQRIEVIVYVDGIFLHEVEQGVLPITLPWDTTGLAPGRHYLTVNVRSYEGVFGAATAAVDVDRPR